MEHEQFDEALMQCIHTLRAGSDMDHAIQNLLEIIAEFHDADRAYIFEFAEDEIHMDNTYEYCKAGITPEKDMLQNLEISTIDRWLVLFEEQGEVYLNSRDGELDENSEEYRLLKMQGVESLMVAPLYSETKLIGFIGVDNPNENTYTLSLLRSVASLIVNDIQKRITLEQRVINALARIYISMYLVNIPADTQKEFNSNSDVRKYVKQTEHASEQMRTAMEQIPQDLTVISIAVLDKMTEFAKTGDFEQVRTHLDRLKSYGYDGDNLEFLQALSEAAESENADMITELVNTYRDLKL